MRIKNWNQFQHFKDRRPPWIKLHRDILEQRDISSISDCSFRVLVGIWLLASEDPNMKGAIPCADDISFRLRIDKPKVIKALKELSAFLIQDDIVVISDGYQDDVPETETETETETEAEGEEKQPSAAPPDTVSSIFEHWREVMKKGPNTKPTPGRINKIKTRLKEGYTEDQIKQAIDGCSKSDFHMGKNEDNKRHDCLALICRSAEKLEQFIGYATTVSADAQREADVQDWINEVNEQDNYTGGETIDHEPF